MYYGELVEVGFNLPVLKGDNLLDLLNKPVIVVPRIPVRGDDLGYIVSIYDVLRVRWCRWQVTQVYVIEGGRQNCSLRNSSP